MRKWLVRLGAVLAVLLLAGGFVAWQLSKRFEPFVREQAIRYMEQRFGSRAELASLRITPPTGSLLRIADSPLRVSGEGLVLWYRNRQDLPPLIRVKSFSVVSSPAALWNAPRRIREVRLRGLEINLPPKRERQPSGQESVRVRAGGPEKRDVQVLVDAIHSDDAVLRIYPNDPLKPPREFEIHRLKLTGAGSGGPLKYSALLTNPKPRGEIETSGEFGPWERDDPGLTALAGDYTFRDADLSVFKGVAGILQSTGRFGGVLEQIVVRGETRTPDFRLFSDGNRVPLTTQFESIVDGTSGDTLLQPIRATLGRTRFLARGGVVRREGAKSRTVDLDVVMQDGHLADLLRLAVRKPKPFMTGLIDLRARMVIPPGELAVVEKLILEGKFDLDRSQFDSELVQEKVDSLSRRAQGQPKNQQIVDVLSAIQGAFRMHSGDIAFSGLNFRVPGADIALTGHYGVQSEQLDFRGTARLQAKVSQTMTGWKRWALKPADPFFSKDGAGTLLRIKILGTKDKPEFGLDRGKDKADKTD